MNYYVCMCACVSGPDLGKYCSVALQQLRGSSNADDDDAVGFDVVVVSLCVFVGSSSPFSSLTSLQRIGGIGGARTILCIPG